MLIVFVPLYKPRPRRILDTITLAQKRTLVAMFALAAIGYFDYTYRLPRMTLLAVAPILLIVLPAWFVWIRRTPGESTRAIIVGDDPDEIGRLAEDISIPLLGYLCPTNVVGGQVTTAPRATAVDGGVTFKGQILRQGSDIVIDLGTITVDATVVNIGA